MAGYHHYKTFCFALISSDNEHCVTKAYLFPFEEEKVNEIMIKNIPLVAMTYTGKNKNRNWIDQEDVI